MPHPPSVDQLLAGLNPAQHQAVTTTDGPLRILAGAGSGKTRVLTRRIAHRVCTDTADAPHVLALTFTRKAAGELRDRLSDLGVRPAVVAGTFHSVAYAQLRRRWADRGERAPALLDRKGRILGPLLGPLEPRGVTVADVAAEIEWAKARMVPADHYQVEAERAGRTPPLPGDQIASLYHRYEAEKRKRGVVDFDDLLGRCAEALATDEEFAAAQRWRFRHLFVDEFQDVNPVQFRLLEGWLGDRNDLCVVGDPNQAIYSWNGADAGLLDDFASRYPTSLTIRLDDNYRSTPQVLAVATAVLGVGGDTAGIQAQRPDGRLPDIRSMPDAAAEADAIAVEIRRHHGPSRPWSDCAVLVRTNGQAVEFERALAAAQIPFRVRGGGGLLRQPEVITALSEMAASPARVPFASRLADVQAAALTEFDPDRRDHLEALVRLGQEFAVLDSRPSVPAFQAWLSATVQGDEPEAGADAVEVVTFHRAKGLEWPVVFVAGLEKGLVPIGRAESPEALAEERRLLYVAMTRARDVLHCSWAQRRTFGERTMHRSASPWLADVEYALARLSGNADTTAWRPTVDRQRTRLRALAGGSDPETAAVLTALKQWRARAARASAVPPYVIFADATLTAIAERRPADRDALLTVPGIGPVKVERYGHDLLALVTDQRESA